MKILIVEDNPGAARLLESYIANYPGHAEVVGTAYTFDEALTKVRALHPDLLLLDIQLEDRNAFDLFHELTDQEKTSLSVIVVTAYFESHYLYRALKVSAIDYITKPVSKEALYKALDTVNDTNKDTSLAIRLEQVEQAIKQLQQSSVVTQIPVHRVDDSIDFTSVEDLEYISTEDHITRLHYVNETLSTTKPLKYYVELLKKDNRFYQASKQAIVNLQNINKYIHKERRIIMESGSEVNVSRRRAVELFRIISGGIRGMS